MKIDNVDISALLDSGSTQCLVGPELLKKIPNAKSSLQKLDNPITGVTANGEKFMCKFQIVMNMVLSGRDVPVTALYSETLNYPLIFGYNFLSENKILIDFENLTLMKKEASSVKLTNAVTLSPHSETQLVGYLRNKLSKGTGLISSSMQMQQLGLLTANSLVTLEEDTEVVPLKVMNLSQSDITIPENFDLATCAVLDENDLICGKEVEAQDNVTHNSTKRGKGVIVPTWFEELFDFSQSTLSGSEQEILLKLLYEYEDIFMSEGKKLGCTDLIEFTIKLRPDAKPLKSKPFRSNPRVRKEIRKQVQQMLEDDIIRPSVSDHVSPVLLVSKADGGLRFVTDFRKANMHNIVQESSPLPRIDCSLESIGSSKAQLFSTLDLAHGYWQVPVEEESKKYTAFCTHDGSYEYNRMPFGLSNSPSCFMRLMTRVLQGLTWEICMVCLGDIIIFSRTFQEHLDRLRIIFDRIRSAKLTLKPKKCSFGKVEIKFLGHLINKFGIKPLMEKIETIKNYPVPKTVKKVRGFLGLVGYYRKFIKDFAKTAGPLFDLTKKDAPFLWSTECNDAFEKLKTALLKPPILAYPNYDEPYILETDCSDNAAGFILSQVQDGYQRVIAYAGKRLNNAQKNFTTTEKEAFAVILGFQHYDSFLRGNLVKVVTDHIALKWLLTQKTPKGRLARWIAYLQQFNYEVIHKPGKLLTNADALSRIDHNDEATDLDADVEDEMFPCERSNGKTMNDIAVTYAITINANTWSKAFLRNHQMKDPFMKAMMQYLEKDTIPESTELARDVLMTSHSFIIDEGVLYHLLDMHAKNIKRQIDNVQLCLVVPEPLRHDILSSVHGDDCAGHFGTNRTYQTLRLKYYWRGMYRDTKNFVLSCQKCNTRKDPVRPIKAPLQPLPAMHMNGRWAMDLINMPRSQRGSKYILTFTEHTSRFVEAFAIPNAQAITIARVLVDEICFRYGAPQCLLSDLGANLISAVVAETCKLFKIERIHTSPYHPQTNSLLEKFNETLCKNLAMYVNPNHTDWDLYIRPICYAYNTSVCTESTQFTPFYLMFGRMPLHPIDTIVLPNVTSSHDSVRETVLRMQEAREIARQNIIEAQTKMKERYDQKANPPLFEPGDLVWIYFPQIMVGGSRKFFHNYSGPYILVKKTSPSNFEVAHAHNNKKLRNIVHVNRMKRFHHRAIVPPKPENVGVFSGEVFNEDEDLNPVDRARIVPPLNSGSESGTNMPPNNKVEVFQREIPRNDDSNGNQEDVFQGEDTNQEEHTTQEEDINKGEETPQVGNLNGSDEYKINKIVHARKAKNGSLEYLIDWKGYPVSARTYEPYSNLNTEAKQYVDTTKIKIVKRR